MHTGEAFSASNSRRTGTVLGNSTTLLEAKKMVGGGYPTSGANPSPFDEPRVKGTSPQSRRRADSAKTLCGEEWFMVSGSSDCSVCIWDLHLGATLDQDDNSSIDDFQTGSAKEEAGQGG